MESTSASQHFVNNLDDIQKAKSQLREVFLRFIAQTNSKYCEIAMHDYINVNGKLKAFDASLENVIVEDLKTPFLPVKRALLRSSDIISITIKDINND